ncbi:hypothetical protein DWZ56_02195 [Lachnotalea sp. AF33-28]|nr:hypothetical protein DWZ56_02195 [Lachnotalea sp. AF33-28]
MRKRHEAGGGIPPSDLLCIRSRIHKAVDKLWRTWGKQVDIGHKMWTKWKSLWINPELFDYKLTFLILY